MADTWIGASDRGTEGTFVWSNGDTWSYASWNADQPDDWRGEDCVEILTTGFWNDLNCRDDRAYLCER